MANLPETEAALDEADDWVQGIYQLEQEDLVLGGAEGIDNLQAKQLLARSNWLKAQVMGLGAGKQPLDQMLTALAALVTAANQTLYFTGPDAPALTALTGYARTLLASNDAAAARAVLNATSPGDVAAAIAALVDSSPATLDTLHELANALGNDPNFATTITNALAQKAPWSALDEVISDAGLTPNHTDVTQLAQAIQAMLIAAQKAVIINAAAFEPTVIAGDAVRWDAGNAHFAKAVADGTSNNRAVGIADVAGSKVYLYGECALFSGLTPGARYFLDATTPGALTTTAPADAVTVGIAKSAAVLWVDVDAAPPRIGVEVGTVVFAPSTTAPDGYVKSNGALLSRTAYAALWAYAQASGNLAASDALWEEGQFSPGDGSTTFRIPDLRGEFFRGFDDGRGIDPARQIGSAQTGSLVIGDFDVASTMNVVGLGSSAVGATHVGADSMDPASYPNGLYVNGNPGTTYGSVASMPALFGQARPRNVALLACIKY